MTAIGIEIGLLALAVGLLMIAWLQTIERG